MVTKFTAIPFSSPSPIKPKTTVFAKHAQLLGLLKQVIQTQIVHQDTGVTILDKMRANAN
jgi:hypothetical protein